MVKRILKKVWMNLKKKINLSKETTKNNNYGFLKPYSRVYVNFKSKFLTDELTNLSVVIK